MPGRCGPNSGALWHRPLDIRPVVAYTTNMSERQDPKRTTPQRAADAMARECLALRARLLSRAITAIYDAALRPAGLRAGQMSILAVLVKEGPLPSGRVGDILVMEKSTLSRNAQRMKEHGWIDLEAGRDGRERVLSITAPGRRVLARAYPLWQTAQRDASRLLGPQGASALLEVANTAWATTRKE